MLQATSKIVRPRLGRSGHEEKDRQSQLCDRDLSPMQHLGKKRLLFSPINHKLSVKGVRSFEEASRGPVSSNQDGDLAVRQRPPT